jgi:hypothetical protein
MRRLLAIALLGSLSGCLLYFDEHGSSCNLTGDDVLEGGDSAPAQLLRNPEQLTCDPFSTGGNCDPSCGPCPAEGLELLAPIPTWGECNSSCDTLDELTCSERSDCRIVKDARCSIGPSACFTDFMGCFPVDTIGDIGVDCAAARDGQTCSFSSACTAFHVNEPCPLDGQCPRPFAMCMPAGVSPGECFAPVSCDRATPQCPPDTTPGISGGCFTGGCIPLELCGAVPQPNE